jgi:hypothetical protein
MPFLDLTTERVILTKQREPHFRPDVLDRDLDDNRKVIVSSLQLQLASAFWIKDYDNPHRLHSTIGYPSTFDYEQRLIATPTLTL